MKILLIQPPVRDFYQTAIRTQPIGLAYLAGSLRAAGHAVEILDCQTGKKKAVSLPPELSYLKEFYSFDDRSPFKLYSGYYHFGMEPDEIEKKIKASGADVFGISSSFTPYHHEAVEIAGIIKRWNIQKIVVMGGAHVSCDPAGVLESPFVDFVILGEGEIRFPLLLEKIEKDLHTEIQEMEGVGYRINGHIKVNPIKTFIENLDQLSYPARDLLDPDRYRIRKKRSAMILTSRGCPHGCAYCSAQLVMGSSFRARTPEAVVEEMAVCRNQMGIEVFDIEDDNFTFDRQRAKRLMHLMIETFGEGKVELSAMNGVSFASLDEELLRLMKRAGFHTLNLSFVSTDPLTKERMGRPKPAEDFDSILKKAEETGLHVIAYAILGMPGQTLSEMIDTLIALTGKKLLIGPSIYYPTPGTVLFERCTQEEILPPFPSRWRSSAFPIETKEFNRLDLFTLFRLARALNFIKGKMDGRALPEGMTWTELYGVLKEKAEDKKFKAESSRLKAEKGKDKKLKAESSKLKAKTSKDEVWSNLLLLLMEEREFFSLKKDSRQEIVLTKERTSKEVLDYFFEQAGNKPILGSRFSPGGYV